jgi:hypothetical protein
MCLLFLFILWNMVYMAELIKFLSYFFKLIILYEFIYLFMKHFLEYYKSILIIFSIIQFLYFVVLVTKYKFVV